MEREFKLQASLHGIDLSGVKTSGEEKPLPITPEQEALAKKALADAQARIKARYDNGRERPSNQDIGGRI